MTVAGKLNVHLVAHSHFDVGWLKTVDQYYVGSNNSIQAAGVQYILDNVVQALLQDTARKFVVVEQAFFSRWWRQQGSDTREAVRRLVQSGQLEFANGGWVMHEEAATNYIDMIDQTSLGHRFLQQEFGVAPRIAWQLDPFGHSAVQAYLLSAEAGFDAVFFGRDDYDDKRKRCSRKDLEFVWVGSSGRPQSAVFGGILYWGYYPPNSFFYEWLSPDPPIQDDEELFDVNIRERVDAFVAAANEQAAAIRTEHIVWTMGGDFTYGNADAWFKNLDKLIRYVNKDGRVHALYSTPSMYLDAKHAAAGNLSWPLKLGDFFPYADCPHCYWTGYFSSRPAFKGYVRHCSALLMAARQVEALQGLGLGSPGGTEVLEEAMATAQHHDAVTGTAKQHATNDYALRLHLGALQAQDVLMSAMEHTIGSKLGAKVCGGAGGGGTTPGTPASGSASAEACRAPFRMCPLLNISFCPEAQAKFAAGEQLVVVAYNPLAWAREEFVQVPVATADVAVSDWDGRGIESQVVPEPDVPSDAARALYVRAHAGRDACPPAPGGCPPRFALVFRASVDPLGMAAFRVTHAPEGTPGRAYASKEVDLLGSEEEDLQVYFDAQRGGGHAGRVPEGPGRNLGREELRAEFSIRGGSLTRLFSPNGAADAGAGGTRGVQVLEEGLLFYAASDNSSGPEASGAYIFRPNGTAAHSLGDAAPGAGPALRAFTGPLVVQVQRRQASWAALAYRFYKGQPGVDIQYEVGPVPVQDGVGKEVIFRATLDLASNASFFTDSNGRDYLRRVRNARDDWVLNVTEPVAGNYYPVNAGTYLTDGTADVSLLVDRAAGVSSLVDGAVEVMLHRRLLYDDNRGVNEALNETVCVEAAGQEEGAPLRCHGLVVLGNLRLSLLPSREAARWRRSAAQRILSPLQLGFSIQGPPPTPGQPLSRPLARSESTPDDHASQHLYPAATTGIGQLPPSVALITLQRLESSVLMRLAHLYQPGEDDELSRAVCVNVSSVLGTALAGNMLELELTGARPKGAGRQRMVWQVANGVSQGGAGTSSSPEQEGGDAECGEIRDGMVYLRPLDVRTFSLS